MREHEYACASLSAEQRRSANVAVARLKRRRRGKRTSDQLELDLEEEA